MTDLDRLIERHPEILKGSVETSSFIAIWLHHPSVNLIGSTLYAMCQKLNTTSGTSRDYTDRAGTLIAAWKNYLVNTEEKPKFGSGAKYLPSGRLVEWELDAAGAPMKLLVDGEPVPAEFLSKARVVNIIEKIWHDHAKKAMRFRYIGVDANTGEQITDYEDEMDDVQLRKHGTKLMEIFKKARAAMGRELEKKVRGMYPGSYFGRVSLCESAEMELQKAVPTKKNPFDYKNNRYNMTHTPHTK